MVDRLRRFWNRPLTDGDRRRLFALAVAAIAAAAGLLALADRPEAPAAKPHPTPQPFAAAPVSTPPAATPQAAPAEEGQTAATLEASPADIARSKRAARAFLRGYLPSTYGRAGLTDLRGVSAGLRRQLRASRPRVPAAERRRRPRLVLLQSDGVSHDRAQLVALIDDGRGRYDVPLELARHGTRWTVTSAGS